MLDFPEMNRTGLLEASKVERIWLMGRRKTSAHLSVSCLDRLPDWTAANAGQPPSRRLMIRPRPAATCVARADMIFHTVAVVPPGFRHEIMPHHGLLQHYREGRGSLP